jgi:hypothetical protein
MFDLGYYLSQSIPAGICILFRIAIIFNVGGLFYAGEEKNGSKSGSPKKQQPFTGFINKDIDRRIFQQAHDSLHFFDSLFRLQYNIYRKHKWRHYTGVISACIYSGFPQPVF